MKVIKSGRVYEIYDDNLQTFDKLPAKTFVIRFSPMTGFFLEEYSTIEVKEEKIYGVHNEKIVKVLKSFEAFERNLGIILSGEKGIGKSLFAKLLTVEAIAKGYPVIIIDTFYPGVASYIQEIQQEVVVLFDEFDKTFGQIKSKDGEADPQAGLLTLFDGMAQGKKMFIITCNEIRCLNDYLINRPGRFHYHIRFDYPNPTEIREYLMDKLEEQFYSEIDKVVAFSRKVNLNYDCLRAIAFEINCVGAFDKAISDLNILNMNSERYDLTLRYKNGLILTANNINLDLFSSRGIETSWMYDSNGRDYVQVKFDVANSILDRTTFDNYIPGEFLSFEYDENFDDINIKEIKKLEPDCLIISKVKGKSLHYLV